MELVSFAPKKVSNHIDVPWILHKTIYSFDFEWVYLMMVIPEMYHVH
jgi:hypothetical protein